MNTSHLTKYRFVDLSDEDFNHSRPPPPRRRKNQKDGLQNNDMGNNKVSLQVELANVRDILEKQGMYETQRKVCQIILAHFLIILLKDDRRPDRRRREMDSRKDSRGISIKSSKLNASI